MQTRIADTDHFWYRPGPEDIYIDSQRANKAFGHTEDQVMLSEDNGATWPHRLAFPNARNITFSCILGNGNVVFATRTRLYVGTDNLRTCEQITVKGLDGSDYLPHTPRNPDLPGWYFHNLPVVNSFEVKGTEMLVWGNYCNVLGGAAPVNIYYSADGGRTVKIAYAFGQNPLMRDDGSPGGGREGTLLGDPDNPVRARHVHAVAYNPAEDAFYACTGDGDREEGFLERYRLRGTYDQAADRWQVAGDHLRSPELALQVRRDQLRGWDSTGSAMPTGRSPMTGDLPLRTRRHRPPRASTLLFNPGIEFGQHDHRRRRVPGVALPGVTAGYRHHHPPTRAARGHNTTRSSASAHDTPHPKQRRGFA